MKDVMDRVIKHNGPQSWCWEWQGHKTAKGGYGRVRVNNQRYIVHRYVYEMMVEAVPEGLQLDHLCRNTSCCNPAHLEPVTCRENILRARPTHCIKGHELFGYNMFLARGGRERVCRRCHNDQRNAYRARCRATGKKVQ